MIPKKIHYCWFGNKPLSKEMLSYIETWKECCPDYEIIRWDESRFDVHHSIPFVKEAYEHKKYAFVSDYVRLYALYNEGGIYMDTDVKLLKSLDSFLDNRFFTSIEYIEDNVRILHVKERLNMDGTKKNPDDIIVGIGIVSAIWGVEACHPYILDCIKFYQDKTFVQSDGSFYDKVILTVVMALCAEKYGFKYIDGEQMLNEGMRIYPREYFTYVNSCTKDSVALHMAYNSWREKDWSLLLYDAMGRCVLLKRIKNRLRKNPFFNRWFDSVKKYVWFR